MNDEHDWRNDFQIRYIVVYYRKFAYIPVKIHDSYVWLRHYYFSEVQYFYGDSENAFKVEHNADIAPHLTTNEYLVHKLCGIVIEKSK